jgi:hypothetical protein
MQAVAADMASWRIWGVCVCVYGRKNCCASRAVEQMNNGGDGGGGRRPCPCRRLNTRGARAGGREGEGSSRRPEAVGACVETRGVNAPRGWWAQVVAYWRCMCGVCVWARCDAMRGGPHRRLRPDRARALHVSSVNAGVCRGRPQQASSSLAIRPPDRTCVRLHRTWICSRGTAPQCSGGGMLRAARGSTSTIQSSCNPKKWKQHAPDGKNWKSESCKFTKYVQS